MTCTHQFDQPRTPFRSIAAGDQSFGDRTQARGNLISRKPEVRQPHHFILTHRNSAHDLGQIFAKSDSDQQLFQLAECSFAGQSHRIGCELADSLYIGGKPGEPVGGALFSVEHTTHDPAFDRDLRAYLYCCLRKEGIQGRARLLSERDHIGFSSRTGCSGGHLKLADNMAGHSHYACTAQKQSHKRFRLLSRGQHRASGANCYKN